ncbi:Uncharacterized protein BP5553_10038 [Venustampulla echinocandica]|uniref:Aminoglycoside phosphotransferase domain-containing protein n=1 Tax=Venustampulla echinocandica TaxID=2656787 RepID=A0A370TA53_9HELO|nr:Uncharacterized protein BP5553_10038 [Venustampulla echinocandica]RDL30693.1 Uncharacterized protein BP5553_10038 [Venustampulla echinocandica]
MTVYDGIAEANGDDECRAWLRKVIDAKDDIVAFVDGVLDGGGAGEFIGFLKGSFNLSPRIGFGDRRQSALIRFAKPGHTTWRAEKVTNEVRFIEYLSQHSTIPLPRVLSWGLTEESPQQLGPFIIMDFIDGTRLSTILKQPTTDDQEDVILNPDIDSLMPDTIYNQLADYILQISRLDFTRIRAISKDHALNTWSATLSINFVLRRLTVQAFRSVASQHLIHLQTQRNLADDAEDAQRRFIARHRFAQLIPKYCINDAGPFKIFCDDMQPSNMLVNPETLRITAVLDFEFTNTVPAHIEEFLARYVPKLEQFLRALERIEAKSALIGQSEEPRLSSRMRDSWKTGRFWFNYAARKSLDIDVVYWNMLYKDEDGAGVELLDDETRAEMEPFTRMKMMQLKAYREECAARLSEKEFE